MNSDQARVIYIGTKQHSWLKQLAAKNQVTMRQLIDEVMNQYVEWFKRTKHDVKSTESLKVSNKVIENKISTVSETHDTVEDITEEQRLEVS